MPNHLHCIIIIQRNITGGQPAAPTDNHIRKQKIPARQVHIFYERKDNYLLKKMRKKNDSSLGKYMYSKRMQIIEPVFANIRSNLKLNKFSLRGKTKVDIQWKIYSIIHNIGKVFRYGPGFA